MSNQKKAAVKTLKKLISDIQLDRVSEVAFNWTRNSLELSQKIIKPINAEIK